MPKNVIRPPAVAGMFYPEQAEALNRELDAVFSAVAPGQVRDQVVALISPHAGYKYSGVTAAYGYKLLTGRSFRTAVVVSPSHREYFDGISVYDGSAFQTPLGILPVDENLREELVRGDPVISSSIRGHRQEHAVEVQLPFLQRMLGEIRILPVVMGDQRREYCGHLGEKLARVLAGKEALLIASSDLSHYHPYEEANALDRVVIDDVEAFDAERLLDHLSAEQVEACGGGPMAAVLIAARALGGTHARILHHCNSGDVTGDKSGVVGYLSAAILRRN